MTRLFVFDIDGTLADINHRLHYINVCNDEQKDWDAFFRASAEDKPIAWVINLLRTIQASNASALQYHDQAEILLLTGRSESIRKQTEDWMRSHTIMYDYLVMRPDKDHSPDHYLKPKMLEDFLRDKDFKVQFIVEDRKTVVEAYRRKGFNVLQCDGGEY